MSRRGLVLGALVASAALLLAGTATRLSAASFTTTVTTDGNVVTVDELANHFAVTPGSDASGNVDTLAIDLGLVASPRTVDDVFTVVNVSGGTRTATLAVDGGGIVSAAFAESGSATVTLAPGASGRVRLTTTAAVAGPVSGTIRLGLAGESWLYRSYSVALTAAPAAPASLTATPKAAGAIELSWAASETTNLAGYDVYRSSGGGWTKRNGTPVAGTSWSDTSTSNGTQYSYRVRAVSSGAPVLESVDSPTATARADATAPTRPSAVALENGGGEGDDYVNLENRASVAVRVTLPAGALATDVVRVMLSNGAQSVAKTMAAPAGGGAVVVTGIDASELPDGTVTISATLADAAGNESAPRSANAPKDTLAPAAPTAEYVDRRRQTDRIQGTTEGNATISAVQTAPSSSGPYTAIANGSGSYTLTVARVDGSFSSPVPVTYLVTATDRAGNTSAPTTLNAEARW